MKKYKKLTRIISLVFALCMLMSVTGVAAYEFKSELELSIPKDILIQMERQLPACEAYDNFITSLPKDSDGKPLYPDDFAGSYIDTDGDYALVIQLTDITEARKQTYMALCKDYENIRFDEVQYSWNYLRSMKSYADELYKAGIPVCGVYVSTKENVLCIEVEKGSSEKAKQHFNTMAVDKGTQLPVTILAGSPISQCSTIYGGDSLYNNGSATWVSVGVCGTFRGYSAILTCGHDNSEYSSVSHQTTSNTTGQVTYSRYSTDYTSPSYGEFSIIKITANTKTMRVRGNGTTFPVSGSTNPALGALLVKYGANGGYAIYEVEDNDDESIFTTMSGSGERAYVEGLIKFQYVSGGTTRHGDSGGPVYLLNGASALMGCTIVGVPADSPSRMYASPIRIAISAGFSLS